jgi:hypothetical protein
MEIIKKLSDDGTAFLTRNSLRILWGLALLVIILAPILVLAQGYMPIDDCLRHAAKAVDGRPWSDILVLRPGILEDPHAPWHALLRGLDGLFGTGPEGLVVLTVGGLFMLIFLAPLPWLEAPDGWILAWVLLWTAGGIQTRLLLGRPFELPMAALLAVMALWRGVDRKGFRAWTLSAALLGIAGVLHGSWYLMALLPAAFLLAGRWRDALELTLCWLAGSFLGACLTGHPLTFLMGQVIHLGHTLGQGVPPTVLVQELQSSRGGGLVGLGLLGVLLFRVTQGKEKTILKDPVFLLALLGWLLGIKIKRFWIDWGYPSAALWLALELGPWLTELGRKAPLRRLALAVTAGMAMIFILCNADESRWADPTRNVSCLQKRPDLKAWYPGKGGILYSPNMDLFFDTYYHHPHADWRYMVGFEPSMMPEKDLATYYAILLDPYNPLSYKPWVDKMGPNDRLALESTRSPAYLAPTLEWQWFEDKIWLGRKPAVPSARP